MPVINGLVVQVIIHCKTNQSRGAYRVPGGAQFVVRLDIEPRAFIAGRVQSHSHGVLLQQGRQPLVHRQELVALDMQQLHDAAVLNTRPQRLLVVRLVLLLLKL